MATDAVPLAAAVAGLVVKVELEPTGAPGTKVTDRAVNVLRLFPVLMMASVLLSATVEVRVALRVPSAPEVAGERLLRVTVVPLVAPLEV